MRRTRCATGRTPACTRAVSTSGHSPDTPGRVSPGDTPDAVPSFRRGPWVQSPQWPSRSPCWRSDCATRGRSGPASGGARTMARIDSQAEAWTTTLRPVLKEYDYILIDCQPSLGLLAINALTVAHGVLIPLECEFFSLRGVALLLDTIDKVRERLNFDLELEGILATMYDSRTTHCRQVLQRVVEAFGDKVYQTVITKTVKFPESTVAGAPITTLDPSSSGARNYRQLAREVIAAHAERRAAF